MQLIEPVQVSSLQPGRHATRLRPLPLGIALLGALLAAAAAAAVPGARSSAPAQTTPTTLPTFFGGIQVNEPDHDRWVAALRDAGLDSVEVTLYARQQRWDEAELWYDREAPWVVAEIRAAKRAGLRVVLVMRVALEHGLEANRHLWHGMIWPRDELWDLWQQRYTEFVLWGAEIAAREQVDLLAIGNEMSSLTSTTPVREIPDLYAYWSDSDRVAAVRSDLVRCADRVLEAGGGDDLTQLDGGKYPDLDSMLRAQAQVHRRWVATVAGDDADDLTTLNRRRAMHERFWRGLIDLVRQHYGGPLTYGANFDQYAQVGFWDALDAVGVNAYFPLGLYGLADDERVAYMESAWRRIAADLQSVAATRPVVLLEMGWTRRAGSTVRPYSYDRVEVLETLPAVRTGLSCVHWATQPLDPGERVAALQALANIVDQRAFPALRGFILWKLTTRPQDRAIEPFAVLLQPGSGYSSDGWRTRRAEEVDALDAAYLRLAASVAATVRQRNQDGP